MSYKDLKKNLFKGKNMGGLQVMGYYAKASDIKEWPKLPDNPSTLGEEVELVGNFKMKPGKKFHAIYSTKNKNSATYSPQGEQDGRSFISKIKIQHPGNGAEWLGFLTLANNDDLVFIGINPQGTKYVIGSEGFPATIVDPNGGSGEGAAGENMGMFEAHADSYVPLSIYKGIIPLTEAASSS